MKSVSKSCPIMRVGAMAGLSALFGLIVLGLAGMMKFAFVAGKAPAEFAAMASKMYPVVVSTPLVHPFGLTASQFVLCLAVFEVLASLAFFFNNKIGAVMVAIVMLGAEYIGFTQAANPAMPANPMCGTMASCNMSHAFHAVLLIMAAVAFVGSKPLCSSVTALCKKGSCWSKWCGSGAASSKKEEAQTPTRPRRAAAMKKKD